MTRAAAAALLLVVATPAAATLPDPVRAMIESAFRDNDQAAITAVIRLAKETYPADTAEIDAMTNGRTARLAAAQAAQREGAGFFEFVHGSIEAGASQTTGNYDSFSAYGSVQLTQSSPHWQHSLNARADYLRSGGLTSTDRLSVAYQADRKFDATRYLYGLAEYDRDPILGYVSRYTAGIGLGFTLVQKPTLRIDVTGGPAVRHTDYVNTDAMDSTPNAASTIAGRASVAVRWQLSPGITFTGDAAGYLEEHDVNATATTGLETPLIGNLKAKLSYNLQYESDPPAGTQSLDTVSRATLLYSF